MFICDRLYRWLETTDRNIIIVTIDEKAEQEYGKFSSWSREKLAELTEYLYSNLEYAPAVLGFDVMFIGDEDPIVDARLASVCEKVGNVVCASNLKYEGVMKTDSSGKYYFDTNHISQIEQPYDALNSVVTTGFANACISKDNIIRTAQLYINHEGLQMDSFAYAVYKKYAASQGIEAIKPDTNAIGQVGFFYSGLPKDHRPRFDYRCVCGENPPVGVQKQRCAGGFHLVRSKAEAYCRRYRKRRFGSASPCCGKISRLRRNYNSADLLHRYHSCHTCGFYYTKICR